MWDYCKLFIDILAIMVFAPVILFVAAGTVYLYFKGIWWVATWVGIVS